MLLTIKFMKFLYYTNYMFVGKGAFPPSSKDVHPSASKEAKNEAEESGPDVLQLKPRIEDASKRVVGSSIHQPLNCWLHDKLLSLLTCPLTHHGVFPCFFIIVNFGEIFATSTSRYKFYI